MREIIQKAKDYGPSNREFIIATVYVELADKKDAAQLSSCADLCGRTPVQNALRHIQKIYNDLPNDLPETSDDFQVLKAAMSSHQDIVPIIHDAYIRLLMRYPSVLDLALSQSRFTSLRDWEFLYKGTKHLHGTAHANDSYIKILCCLPLVELNDISVDDLISLGDTMTNTLKALPVSSAQRTCFWRTVHSRLEAGNGSPQSKIEHIKTLLTMVAYRTGSIDNVSTDIAISAHINDYLVTKLLSDSQTTQSVLDHLVTRIDTNTAQNQLETLLCGNWVHHMGTVKALVCKASVLISIQKETALKLCEFHRIFDDLSVEHCTYIVRCFFWKFSQETYDEYSIPEDMRQLSQVWGILERKCDVFKFGVIKTELLKAHQLLTPVWFSDTGLQIFDLLEPLRRAIPGFQEDKWRRINETIWLTEAREKIRQWLSEVTTNENGRKQVQSKIVQDHCRILRLASISGLGMVRWTLKHIDPSSLSADDSSTRQNLTETILVCLKLACDKYNDKSRRRFGYIVWRLRDFLKRPESLELVQFTREELQRTRLPAPELTDAAFTLNRIVGASAVPSYIEQMRDAQTVLMQLDQDRHDRYMANVGEQLIELNPFYASVDPEHMPQALNNDDEHSDVEDGEEATKTDEEEMIEHDNEEIIQPNVEEHDQEDQEQLAQAQAEANESNGGRRINPIQNDDDDNEKDDDNEEDDSEDENDSDDDDESNNSDQSDEQDTSSAHRDRENGDSSHQNKKQRIHD